MATKTARPQRTLRYDAATRRLTITEGRSVESYRVEAVRDGDEAGEELVKGKRPGEPACDHCGMPKSLHVGYDHGRRKCILGTLPGMKVKGGGHDGK